ncbi:MAG: RNA polymerase sigma factor [Tepidisphaeraceae bacterium]
MNVDSLDALLDKLNSGDDAAAEQAFVAYEPYLRKVVRRLLPAQLRSKFDSIDVVQSVYGDVLVAFRAGGMRFGTAAQLRAFLIKATRNRFIDRVRQHQTAARLETPLGEATPNHLPSSARPRPSESAAAGELWEQLLALCPPKHHQLLHLRKGGATAAEIATQVGMHEGSVRRVLRDLAVRLACSLVPEPKVGRP